MFRWQCFHYDDHDQHLHDGFDYLSRTNIKVFLTFFPVSFFKHGAIAFLFFLFLFVLQ